MTVSRKSGQLFDKISRFFSYFHLNLYSTRAILRIIALQRRDGRVVEGATLEMWCTARYRGFESLSLRHFFCPFFNNREQSLQKANPDFGK